MMADEIITTVASRILPIGCELRDIQRKAVSACLEKQNVIVSMQTGGGKTNVYKIAADVISELEDKCGTNTERYIHDL